MEHSNYQAHRDAQVQKDITKQALAVFRDRHGVIDGVGFDLRHKDVDTSNWRPPIYNDEPKKPANAPFIWFPWFGTFDEQALYAKAEYTVTRRKINLTPNERLLLRRNRVTAEIRLKFDQSDEEKIKTYIAEHTPKCKIFRGDTIKIDRVKVKPIGSAIDHPHDREIRESYLCVCRAGGGQAEQIDTPMVYTGKTAIMDYDVSHLNFANITQRIREHFRLSDLHEMPSVENDGSLAYLALRKALAVASANKDYLEPIRFRGPEEEFHDGSDVWYTINDAMMMGYLVTPKLLCRALLLRKGRGCG
jgi:hypothetical protein